MSVLHPLSSFLLVVLVAVPILAHSPKDGQIFAAVGPVLSKTIVDRTFDGKADAKWGGGLLVSGDLRGRWGMEIGMMSILREYYVSTFGTEIVEKVRRIHIPIMARYRLWSFLALGVGPFGSYTTGEVRTSSFSNQSALSDTRTSANDTAEHGFDFSFALDFPIKKDLFLLVDGRYSWSLTSKQFEKADHWNVFVGIKVPLPGPPPPKPLPEELDDLEGE